MTGVINPDDVPSWTGRSFVRSALALGATANTEHIDRVCRRLIAIWCEPERIVHNIGHVMDMLSRVETLAPETHDPDQVRLATWLHGIVFRLEPGELYTRNGGEDELASASEGADILREIGIPEDRVMQIGELITSLHHRHTGLTKVDGGVFDPDDMNQAALRDAHLAILASDPKRYKRYTSGVREEYRQVDDETYYLTRKRILSRLLARKRLFISPLAQAWEDAARQNVTAELQRVAGQLVTLSAVTSENAVKASESPASAPMSVKSNAEATSQIVDDVHEMTAGERRSGLLSAPSADTPANATTMTLSLDGLPGAGELLASCLPDERAPEVESTAAEDELAVHEANVRRMSPAEFRSTLEDPDASFDPGMNPDYSDPEAQQTAIRESIAADSIEKITQKSRQAAQAREAEDLESSLEREPEDD